MAELLFTGNYETRLDEKGRTSVPAPFRNKLKSLDQSSFYAYPSRHQSGVLECADLSKMNRMKAAMDRLSPMSPVRRKLELSIFSRAHEIVFDNDGRTVVPKPLRNAAGLEGAIYFKGCGESFEIWNAKVHEAAPANPTDWTGEEEQAFDKAWVESRAAEGARP